MTSEATIRKLIDQAKASLEGRSDEEPRQIARRFADLTNEIGERLDRCCALVRSGHRREALEVAESPPALLDVIALVGFAQLPAWEALCRREQWPVGSVPDSAKIGIVNGLYASSNFLTVEILWKKYRDAVGRRNDQEAADCLREILVQLPEDPAAKAEFERLRSKLVRRKMEELAAAMAENDAVSVERLFHDLEALDADAFHEASLYAESRTIVIAHQTKLRSAECRSLASLLPGLLATSAYEEVRNAVDTIGLHSAISDPALDSTLQQHVLNAQKWIAAEDDRRRETLELQELIHTLRASVAEIEGHGVSIHRLPTPSLETIYQRFNLDWQKALRFGRELPEHLQVSVTKNLRFAREELERRRAVQRARGIAIGAFGLLVVGATAFASFLWWKAESVCTEIDRLLATKYLEALVSLVEDTRSNSEMMTAVSPHLRSTLTEADAWVDRQRGSIARMEAAIPGLQSWAENSFEDSNPEEAYERVAAVQHQLDSLPVDSQEKFKESLTPVFDLWALRETELTKQISASRKDLLAELTGELTAATGARTLSELSKCAIRLKDLRLRIDASMNSPIPALAAAEHERIAFQRQIVETEKVLALDAGVQSVERKCREARDLSAYQAAVKGYLEERFLPFTTSQFARKVVSNSFDYQAFRGRLLMPDSPEGWKHLYSARERSDMFPENVTEFDAQILAELISGQKSFGELHRCEFLDNKGPKKTVQYTQGAPITYEMSGKEYLSRCNFYNNEGEFEVLDLGRGATRYSLPSSPVLVPEASIWKSLEIDKVLTSSQRFYVAPLYEVFDRISRGPEDCVVLRAYLFSQLGKIVLAEPLEWRLYLCPRLKRDLAVLEAAGAGKLSATSWMGDEVPQATKVKFAAVLRPFKGSSYHEEAKMNRSLVTKAGALEFAGFVALDGTLALRAEAAQAESLFAVDPDARQTVLTRKKREDGSGGDGGLAEWEGAATLPPLTYFFHAPTNPADVVNDLPGFRAMDPVTWKAIVISPFFPPPSS